MSNAKSSSDLYGQFPFWGRCIRRINSAAFGVQIRLLSILQVTGQEHLVNGPGTLVMFSHKSEFDGTFVGPTLRRMVRNTGPISESAYLAGEHVFQPSFLSGWVIKKPKWLRRLLFPVSVAPIMRAMRTIPVPLARSRFLINYLLDIQKTAGDLPLIDIFNEPPQTLLPGAPENAAIRDVVNPDYLDPLFAIVPFTCLKEPYQSTLLAEHNERITMMIRSAARVLDTGGVVVMAPEGLLSPDGRIRRIKSGLSQIIRETQSEPNLVPLALTFDYMTTGRFGAFVNFGPALKGAKSWTVDETASTVAQTLAKLTTVTLAHLVAHELIHGRDDEIVETDVQSLRSAVEEASRRCIEAGLVMDKHLVDLHLFETRWKRFLQFCVKRRYNDGTNVRLRVNVREGWKGIHPSLWTVSPWEYSYNEYHSLLEAHGLEPQRSTPVAARQGVEL